MKLLMRKKGITIIEIIVSLAILGILAISFLSIFSNGVSTIFSSGNKSLAMKQAQTISDRIYDTQNFSDLDTAVQGILLNIYGTGKYKKVLSSADIYSTSYTGEAVRYYIENIQLLSGLTRQRVTALVFYENGKRNIVLSSIYSN